MAIYQEDDWIAEVEILEDTSNKVWESYKLRVIKSTHKSKFFKTPKDGKEFYCKQKKSLHGMVFDLKK